MPIKVYNKTKCKIVLLTMIERIVALTLLLIHMAENNLNAHV